MNKADANGIKRITIMQHSQGLDGPIGVPAGPPTLKGPKHILVFVCLFGWLFYSP